MNTEAMPVICDRYKRWREMIFTLTPEQADVSPDDADTVYAVTMDIGLRDRGSPATFVLSLIAVATGEASFHPTPGGSVIGVGNYSPKAAQTAQEIVQIAQTLWDQTRPTEDLGLPPTEFVQFHLLTTSGIRFYRGHLRDLQTPANPFGALLSRFGFIRQIAERILDQEVTS
jgi:hypothetical protein